MKSRWQTQLEALGLEPTSSAEAALEKRAYEKLSLPDLVLPPPPSRPWKKLSVAAGLMALVVAYVLVQRADDDPLRMKGRAQIKVWWERAGVIRALGDGGPLSEGDRVRAEVQSPNAATAYWLVVDAAGKPLVDSAFVLASALPLEAGKSVAFAQSLKIVGPAAGETLVIAVCTATLTAAQAERLLADDAPQPCETQSFTLRSGPPGRR